MKHLLKPYTYNENNSYSFLARLKYNGRYHVQHRSISSEINIEEKTVLLWQTL